MDDQISIYHSLVISIEKRNGCLWYRIPTTTTRTKTYPMNWDWNDASRQRWLLIFVQANVMMIQCSLIAKKYANIRIFSYIRCGWWGKDKCKTQVKNGQEGRPQHQQYNKTNSTNTLCIWTIGHNQWNGNGEKRWNLVFLWWCMHAECRWT